MKKEQELVEKFVNSRNWENPKILKDLLLNIVEETGEAWNIIKWVDEKKQQELVVSHKDKFEDFIGDTLYLILRISNTTNVDAEIALKKTIKEYEQRFPKGTKSANILAGGTDLKYQKN
jgi:NTP pyrophosphatase (non-canonical NTP hydrolase)